MDLFDKNLKKGGTPLADRMRPESLYDFIGQKEIIASGKPLRQAIEDDSVTSLIFWGPPGSGKTTLAEIIAKETKASFVSLSAVSSKIAEVKKVFKKAEDKKKFNNIKTIIFIDEIHRFNKAQQDAFLPFVEKGTVILIGATTENPSFEVIAPLISRSKVIVLKSHNEDDLKKILKKALLDKKKGLGKEKVKIDKGVAEALIGYADGDARVVLNTLEYAVLTLKPDKDGKKKLTIKYLEEVIQSKTLRYDKDGEEHFNLISALHKSMRNSDDNAALYWLARMIRAGEDPKYIARRMIRFASEDIGNADPRALVVAMSAAQAFNYVGLPEGNLALAQVAVYMARAPKNNELYQAYGEVEKDIDEEGALPVPLHLRNPESKLMKDIGYGQGYKYAHNYKDKKTNMQCMPDKLKKKKYFKP